jgi:5'-AMP-activated protein kinase regulatory gamma subunit
LVDGVWRCDETKPCVRDEYGLISNEVLVDNTHPVVQPETSIRVVSMDEGTILTTVCIKVSFVILCILFMLPNNL